MGFLSGLFYFTFVALMITNLFLWKYIKRKKLANVNSMKHIKISIVFALSYSYRAVYDTFLAYDPDLIKYFAREHTVWW